MAHIWDILDQVDAEDRKAMQEAYNLTQELRKEIRKQVGGTSGNTLYEMACKLNWIIAHWWELYIENKRRAGRGDG